MASVIYLLDGKEVYRHTFIAGMPLPDREDRIACYKTGHQFAGKVVKRTFTLHDFGEDESVTLYCVSRWQTVEGTQEHENHRAQRKEG